MQKTRWRRSALSALAVFVLFVVVLSLRKPQAGLGTLAARLAES